MVIRLRYRPPSTHHVWLVSARFERVAYDGSIHDCEGYIRRHDAPPRCYFELREMPIAPIAVAAKSVQSCTQRVEELA